MKIGAFVDFLEVALKNNRRILSVGAPGVGKTFSWREAAKRLGWDFRSLSCPTIDPTYIRGYPYRLNGSAAHAPFGVIHEVMATDKPTVLLFDDIGMATESVLKSVVEFIQFGSVDSHKLPNHVVIGAATNDVKHGAGVYGMIEPLKTRFHSIVEVETSIDDLMIYGMVNNWPDILLAYLRTKEDRVHDWKPSKSMHVDGACPRSWEYVAEWINHGVWDSEVLKGCVGPAALELIAFKDFLVDLPDLDDVIKDPEKARLPDNPSAQYFVTTALARKMSAKNFGPILKYTQRMRDMFTALCVRTAIRAESAKRKVKALPTGYSPISSAPEFTQWACSEQGQQIMGIAGN